MCSKRISNDAKRNKRKNTMPDHLYSFFLTKSKILEYKKAGRKIIGTLCNSVPEEIIHSLGAVPTRLLGLSKTTENADLKLPRWLCSYARRILEDGLRGDLNYLDGVVGITSDDTKMRLYSTYTFYVKNNFSYIIQMPYVRSENSLKFFSMELERFAHKLSNHLLCDFNRDRLKESIKIYNKFRLLCKEVCGLRVNDTPKICGADWMKIMLGSISTLKEDFNKIVEDELESLKDSEGIKDYKLRVHISGTDFYDVELLQLIESLGAIIVSDDLCTATGYFSGFVNEGEEPFEDLAERYLSCSACTFTAHPNVSLIKDRIGFIKKEIERSKADAIIILRDKGCEIYGWQCSSIMEELQDFPILLLDIDTPISLEQYKTRIEAFIESYGD